ncbi:short-chain oxidoreductase [Phellopilus nigrolimitatus]|nr:short-chain oxidoreductase [Phellopilus nigrolimitatus]
MTDKFNILRSTSSSQKVWFITGTSSGLGRELVLAALARGDKVIATARTLSNITELKAENKEACHIMPLDVTADFANVQKTAEEAIGVWGHVDVVVNNAGIGILAHFEELGYDGALAQMKTNYLGPLNVTNAFLPHMRARREGTLVFIGSRSAWLSGNPMTGGYCASKAALNAAADNIAAEVAPFGIRVLNALPGGLRTQNRESILRISPSISKSISDYEPVRKRMTEWLTAQMGKETGDPAKTALVIVDIVRGEGFAVSSSHHLDGGDDAKENGKPIWPSMLALGEDAETDIRNKCLQVLHNLDEWKDVSRSIMF